MFQPKLFDALHGYTAERWWRDVGAGLTVGVVALPLAMAFAIASLRAGAEIVIDDPGAYTAKWSFPLLFEFLPDTEMIEDLCDNERDSRHSVGK